MKKIVMLFFVAFTALLQSNKGFAATTSNPADSTFIYVYRVGQWNAAGANWAIYIDDEKKCKLSNNKFMKIAIAPGKHKISARVGGAGIFKKETEIEIDAESGGSYYVACNVKQSITRARLEMIEVTKNSAAKQMEKMKLDNCQENID